MNKVNDIYKPSVNKILPVSNNDGTVNMSNLVNGSNSTTIKTGLGGNIISKAIQSNKSMLPKDNMTKDQDTKMIKDPSWDLKLNKFKIQKPGAEIDKDMDGSQQQKKQRDIIAGMFK